MDLVSVEGRDECLVQQGDGLVGDLVGGALRGVDAPRVRLQLAERADHRRELAATLDNAIGVGVDKVEKLDIEGHKASQHRYDIIHGTMSLCLFNSAYTYYVY